MLNDDYGERSQRPTERRRREARARGQVARSSQFVSAIALLTAAVCLWSMNDCLTNEFSTLMKSSIQSASRLDWNEHPATSEVSEAGFRISLKIAPILCAILGITIAANVLQTGFLWTPGSIVPNFDRINPDRRWQNWWSVSSWMESGSFLLRFAILIVVLGVFVRSRLDASGPLSEGSSALLLNSTSRLIGECSVLLAVTLLVFSVVDYGWQYWKHEKSLMMTVEEVRREQREENGDPRIKREQRRGAAKAMPHV